MTGEVEAADEDGGVELSVALLLFYGSLALGIEVGEGFEDKGVDGAVNGVVLEV